MMQAMWKAWAAAAVLAVVLGGAGCTPPVERCDEGSCPAGQTCNADTGRCVAQGLCDGKTCPSGMGCVPSSGECAPYCLGELALDCTGDETCSPKTGKCENKCASVTCSDPTAACNPQNGLCEPRCRDVKCAKEEVCEPTSGQCVRHCETATRPIGGAECGEGLKCKRETGECVPKCDGVVCAVYGQYCVDGVCKSGDPIAGYPGARCGSDDQCGVFGAPAGQQWTCKTEPEGNFEFAGGYCTAQCSASQPCPQGSECAGGECLDLCGLDRQCGGEPYRCLAGGNFGLDDQSKYVCYPWPRCTGDHCGQIGDDCRAQTDCAYGLDCYPEVGRGGPTGFEGGYCMRFMRSSDNCPSGSVPAALGDYESVCLKRCTAGDVNGCGLGETCTQVSQSARGCWFAECVTGADCGVARCSPTLSGGMAACGRGQTCVGVDPSTQIGTCRTVSTCSESNPCPAGEGVCNLDIGECWQPACEPGTATCQDKRCTANSCAAGTTCNSESGICERHCLDDAACGANAWCELNEARDDGLCVMRCTRTNEAQLCTGGSVCEYSTGRCKPPCSSDDECSGDLVCDTGSGRCVASCADDPAVCGANERCDAGTGACVARCTNDSTCASGTYCQTSTGICLPDCKDNPSICGDEACSVLEGAGGRKWGVCGRECYQAYNCGREATGLKFACEGAPLGRCVTIDCSGDADVCGANATCVDGQCKLR